MADQLSAILAIANTLVTAALINFNPLTNRDAPLVCDMIRNFGYPAETHSVTTQDGYILELHRIPHSPRSPSGRSRPVVFLQHGLGSCSADWVLMGMDKGFGFILADLGYDVWLGNARGTTYSRNHTRLNPDTDRAFWNYSFHELGVYDNPAAIDYILAETGQPKLFYVGHSQGTTQFYVMASERPEYNDKIRAMFSFAPVATMADAESPFIKLLAASRVTSKQVENLIGVRETGQRSTLYKNLAKLFCVDGHLTQILCETSLFLFTGFDSEQLNSTMLPEILEQMPAGFSTKQSFHFLQGILSAEFRQYDYGRRENLQRYGTETPPAYNTSKITAPVALHYSTNDWLAPAKGVDKFYTELMKPIGKFLVPLRKFNHIDFVYAIDAKSLLYDHVTELMSRY